MLTRCPSCHARAKLPDDHAGTKVRCADCGRVFVARPDEVEGSSPRSHLGLVLGGLLGLLALIVLIALVSMRSGDVSAAEAPAGTAEPEDK